MKQNEKTSVSANANADTAAATSPKAKSPNAPPPPEIERLSEVLKQHEELSDEIKKHEKLADRARKEVDEFVVSGDLSDRKRITELSALPLQATFADRRLQALTESLGAVEKELVEQNRNARGVVYRLLDKLVKLHVDKMTEVFKPHFPSVEEARSKAGLATAPMEANQQLANFSQKFSYLSQYEANNPSERAAGILDWFKKAETELAALEEQKSGAPETASK